MCGQSAILLLLLVRVSAPRSFLLVSQRAVIRRLPVNDAARMSLDVTLPVHSLHSVRSLAYNVHTDFVYWVDARTKSIRRARDDGTHVRLSVCSSPVLLLLTFYCATLG